MKNEQITSLSIAVASSVSSKAKALPMQRSAPRSSNAAFDGGDSIASKFNHRLSNSFFFMQDNNSEKLPHGK